MASSKIANPKEMGSSGGTPNNMLVINFAAPKVRTAPSAIPVVVNCMARPSTIPRMLLRSAPKVIRTPTSKVRCATVYAITP